MFSWHLTEITHTQHATQYLAAITQLYVSCCYSNLISHVHTLYSTLSCNYPVLPGPCSPSVRSTLLTQSLSSVCGNSLHPPKSISRVTFSMKPFLKPRPPPGLFLFWIPALRLCSLQLCQMFPAFWLTLHNLTTRRDLYLSLHFTHLHILWETNLQRWVARTVEPVQHDWISFINLSQQEKSALCVSTCMYFHRSLLPSSWLESFWIMCVLQNILATLSFLRSLYHFTFGHETGHFFCLNCWNVSSIHGFFRDFISWFLSFYITGQCFLVLFRGTSLFYFLCLLINQMIRKQVKSLFEVSRMKLPVGFISTFGVHSRVIVSGEKALSITSVWQSIRLMLLQQPFLATFPLI